jgi:uncharacterized membrane protein YvlD (DUF360 family)
MRRVRLGDLGRLVLAWAISSLALVVAVDLVAGIRAEPAWWLVVVAAVTGAFGVLVRPLLVGVAAAIGWWAVALLAVFGQAVVMHLALLVVPGVESNSFWAEVAVTWVAAVLATALTWVATAGTDDAFVASVRRNSRRRPVADPDVDGVLFVQLDGVSFPVLRWAVQSGIMPTLHRWVTEGSHRMQEWTVQLPCTTPASQLGILHGTVARVPAFRWYDRELGRVVVANRPGDAALIESRATDGAGLLARDGMSVSNLFSGDAARTSMTMSRVALTRASRDTRQAVGSFLVRPDGFVRSLSRTTAEVVRERFQALRQRRRRVTPRVHRSWTFAVLRALTNGLLRDLNTAIVARELLRGTHSVYVDYVDYDEVAHHAGASRLESLKVLEALDQVLNVLQRVAAQAPRQYHVVVLSDHGQSQGQPFAPRYGQDLAALCADLTSADVVSVSEQVESWGRVDSLVEDLAGTGSAAERAADSVATRVRARAESAGDDAASDLVVLGSGNLGLVYVRAPVRLCVEQLDARWPELVRGLRTHPGVGFVAGVSAARGPVALGRDGVVLLQDGRVEGLDPLAGFPDHARDVLLRAVTGSEAPELYVNSSLDPSTLEVAAFENLLGCHGGLGGWQDRGALVVPRALSSEETPIQGADRLHGVLVAMLDALGHPSVARAAEAQT